MNELMHLSEEFDLPNAAPATLQVIARTECLPLRIMVPDAARDVGDLVDGAEIQRPPPNERPDGTKEILAQSLFPRSRAGANESLLLPAKRGRFIIGNGRDHRKNNRGDRKNTR